MGSIASFSYQDYSKEKSTARFAVVTFTAANFDATNTLIIALQTAITGVQTEDCLADRRVISDNTFVTRTPPLLKASQRENKWLLLAEDGTTHKLFRHEVPCADPQYLVNNTDFANLADGAEMAALKTAFDAVVKSPAGNSASLLSAQYVGKRI